MKNIQIIDGALNAAYSVYAADEASFRRIFPGRRDIEFVEDFYKRVGKSEATQILKGLWTRPVLTKEPIGLHGTLFFGLLEKKPSYPGKIELDMNGLPPQFQRFSRS